MGKAKIISHVGEGEYVIEVLHARERIDAEIERLSGIIEMLDEQIEEIHQELSDLKSKRSAIVNEIHEAISASN